MKPDVTRYDGRVPAFVKHTFLSHYLPALCQKVSSVFGEFIYIDGFAGPWKASDTEAYQDTSFGVALDAMGATRGFQRKQGRAVKMTAYLVEKDDAAFAELKKLAGLHAEVTVHPIHGAFESHFSQILAKLPPQAFVFSLIDPKGMKLDLRSLHPLLARKNSEVLINFMYDFISRFVRHPNEAIGSNMKALLPHVDWDDLVARLKKATCSEERERLIVNAFRASVKREGGFAFVPSLTVQKTLSDRTLYHLVFGTRSAIGLEVFRQSQVKALTAQATVRSKAKDEQAIQITGQGSLWGGADREIFDFSTRQIEEGLAQGRSAAEQIILSSAAGIRWKNLWPSVLNDSVITTSGLGRAINDLRKLGRITAPDWPSEKKIIPVSDQLLLPPNE
jgi:three-Cys-motif partner protein